MQTIRCLTYFLKKQIFGANDVLFISNGPSILVSRGDYFRFGSVFFKKITKPVFFKKKKPKPVQTDRFRSGSVSLEQKPIKTDLARFFFQFFLFGFGFFSFRLIKPNRTVF
jgi:hypothetical protein